MLALARCGVIPVMQEVGMGTCGHTWQKKKKASPYLKTLKLGMVVLMLSRQEAEVGG
jgi:hypothetical protein